MSQTFNNFILTNLSTKLKTHNKKMNSNNNIILLHNSTHTHQLEPEPEPEPKHKTTYMFNSFIDVGKIDIDSDWEIITK